MAVPLELADSTSAQVGEISPGKKRYGNTALG
jgi:hypothetical protein